MNLAPSSATDTLSSSGSGSTSAVLGGQHDTQTDTTDDMCSVSYNNTSGRTVTVQFEAQASELFVYSGPVTTNFTTAEVQVVVSGAVSGNGTTLLYDMRAAAIPYAGNYHGGVKTYQVDVANGGTLSVTVRLHSVIPATDSTKGISGQGQIRGAAIKA